MPCVVAVIRLKDPLPMFAFGLAKLGLFRRLKDSARNWRLIASRIGKVLNKERFSALCGGPKTWLRCSLPSRPEACGTNAAALNQALIVLGPLFGLDT